MTILKKKKKKYFILEDWDFFSKLGEKSPKFNWEGARFWPLRTQKKIPLTPEPLLLAYFKHGNRGWLRPNFRPLAQIDSSTFLLIPLWTGNPKTGTLANSEDPDEMTHNAAFHQGLHWMGRQNLPSEKELYNILGKL